MSRARDRADMDSNVRVRLLESDADRIEGDQERIWAEFRTIRSEMKEGFARCEADNEGQRRLLVSLLVAVVTTCITITGTVLVTAGGL